MKDVNPWFSFLGILFFLIGAYAALHVAYNLTLQQYPQSGVLTINTSGMAPSFQRESDCTYSQIYYSEDGQTTRPPTDAEKRQSQMDTERCLRGIAETRREVMNQDIGVSALFLFVGAGLLLNRRFLRK